MPHKAPTDRAINEIRDLVRACSQGIDGATIERKTGVEAENLSNITVKLHNTREKVGFEQANRILENIFKYALAIKAFQRRTGFSSRHEIVFVEN